MKFFASSSLSKVLFAVVLCLSLVSCTAAVAKEPSLDNKVKTFVHNHEQKKTNSRAFKVTVGLTAAILLSGAAAAGYYFFGPSMAQVMEEMKMVEEVIVKDVEAVEQVIVEEVIKVEEFVEEKVLPKSLTTYLHSAFTAAVAAVSMVGLYYVYSLGAAVKKAFTPKNYREESTRYDTLKTALVLFTSVGMLLTVGAYLIPMHYFGLGTPAFDSFLVGSNILFGLLAVSVIGAVVYLVKHNKERVFSVCMGLLSVMALLMPVAFAMLGISGGLVYMVVAFALALCGSVVAFSVC